MAREGTSSKDLAPFSVQDPLGQGMQNSAEERLLQKIHESDEQRRSVRSRSKQDARHDAAAHTGELAQASASSSVATAYSAASVPKRLSAERVISVLLILVVLYAVVDWAMPSLLAMDL